MDRHFACTLCGKCCTGLLPLLLDEALTHADRFPLAMLWTVVRPGAPSYRLTQRLGTTVTVSRRKAVAVQITPVSYLPERLACPELHDQTRCRIHDHKPIRCRAMPVSAYREEADQDRVLQPRPGWLCDVSPGAPLVYRNGRLLDRAVFEDERRLLEEQAPILKAYADRLLSSSATVVRDLEVLSKRPAGGWLALSFTGVLGRLPGWGERGEYGDFARRQGPVLARFAGLTAANPAWARFTDHYRSTERGLAAWLS